MSARSASPVITLLGIGHWNWASTSPAASALAPSRKLRCTGSKVSKPIPSTSNMVATCCAMPLPAGPMETRLPRRSSTVSSPDPRSAMKNIGPEFAGAAMRMSSGRANGDSPRAARPIQLAARKPNSISPDSSSSALPTLAVGVGKTSTRSNVPCSRATLPIASASV